MTNMLEGLIDDAMAVLHHDADGEGPVWEHERECLRRRFSVRIAAQSDAPGGVPQSPAHPATINDIHSALAAADLEYSGFSCNGVNVVGDRDSINKVTSAFHSHSQIDWYQRNLRHWREECGKLHAKLASSDTRPDGNSK